MISTRYGLGLHDEQLQKSDMDQLELSMQVTHLPTTPPT